MSPRKLGAEMQMRAMLLDSVRRPLVASRVDVTAPGAGEVLVRVAACAVCRTDLHVIDGDLPRPKIPVVPGHEIIGRVEAVGAEVSTHRPGDRVGIPWLGGSGGVCEFCRTERENLCRQARYTGYQIDGG